MVGVLYRVYLAQVPRRAKANAKTYREYSKITIDIMESNRSTRAAKSQ